MSNILTIIDDEPDKEPEFERPNNSKWIVSVDFDGMVSILDAPNIHPSFFDNGKAAEDIGLPGDVDCNPGVYEWVCSYHVSRDWESGIIDDYYFEVSSDKLLWEPTNE